MVLHIGKEKQKQNFQRKWILIISNENTKQNAGLILGTTHAWRKHSVYKYKEIDKMNKISSKTKILFVNNVTININRTKPNEKPQNVKNKIINEREKKTTF